jgi:hypothetical protein
MTLNSRKRLKEGKRKDRVGGGMERTNSVCFWLGMALVKCSSCFKGLVSIP